MDMDEALDICLRFEDFKVLPKNPPKDFARQPATHPHLLRVDAHCHHRMCTFVWTIPSFLCGSVGGEYRVRGRGDVRAGVFDRVGCVLCRLWASMSLSMSRIICSKAEEEEEAKVAGRDRSQRRGERRGRRGGRAVTASSSPPPFQPMKLRREIREALSAAVAGLSFFHMPPSLSHPASSLQPPACPAVPG
jgi:hypothetical protein